MIKWNGNLLDVIVFDIANWGGKLAFIFFVFSISHFYAYLILGLGVIKFASDQVILWKERKILTQARKDYEQSMKQALEFQKQMDDVSSNLVQFIEEENLDVQEIVDEEDLPPPPKKDYIQ